MMLKADLILQGVELQDLLGVEGRLEACMGDVLVHAW